MAELRKDYLLDRWVIIASNRNKRPRQLVDEHKRGSDRKICFFCPGNESLTPPEIGRVEYKEGWKIRWFNNKFGAVDNKGNFKIVEKSIYDHSYAQGNHEIIVDTDRHDLQLWDLPVGHIAQLLEVYKLRIESLEKNRSTKYVVVFKNHGKNAGASLEHSHTQVVALPFIPPEVKEKLKAYSKKKRATKKCPYCDIIKKEMKSERRIYENKSFAAFAPYASRFNYEAVVFPKKHILNLSQLSSQDVRLLADALKKILNKLRWMNVSYNFYIHYSPKGRDMHMHFEIIPRMSTWAGFEFGSGITINVVPPEAAAKFYRSRKNS